MLFRSLQCVGDYVRALNPFATHAVARVAKGAIDELRLLLTSRENENGERAFVHLRQKISGFRELETPGILASRYAPNGTRVTALDSGNDRFARFARNFADQPRHEIPRELGAHFLNELDRD